MKKKTKKCELCQENISLSNYDKHIKVCNGNGKYKALLNCPHCNLDLSETDNKKVGAHVRWCDKNPKKTGNINNINWDEIQKAHDSGVFWCSLRKMFDISIKQLDKALKYKFLNKINHDFHHTEESKKIISEKRKKFLSENKNSHVWKRNDKFKSVPCEYFKNILKENLINFIEEYSPITSNSFSIDIAFPDKKIGIEINGNQHYNKDKTLKEYYKNRHEIIKKEEWKLFQVHYSLVYKKEFIDNFIEELKSGFNLENIDYSFYLKKEKSIKLCKCGREIKIKTSKSCIACGHINRRKVERPPLLQLKKDIEECGYSGTGRKYGVSDVAVRKWLNVYEKNETLF